ncbi:olfactory receptor 148-like [Gracilinanus agilis]|uniref:olfactory receptor 148-like n=1 Tax=Gracilinanus agilis TaxID=191870 RepID=UPI001CFD5AF2|nr:olfactory receptor 148-like [Gracilinanus agilis]
METKLEKMNGKLEEMKTSKAKQETQVKENDNTGVQEQSNGRAADSLLKIKNYSEVTEFILLGIPHTQGLETVLFGIFLFIYIFTLLGNFLILVAIISSSRLHTPMYFFLGLLSTFDMFFPSVSSPKLLVFLSGNSRVISYKGCASQLFFHHFMGCTEGILYSVMSYDRFVAICHPLRYTVIMNPRLCVVLAACTTLIGCIHATILTSLTFQLPYCGPNEVDYYFCDIPAIIPLACADNSLVQRVGFTNVGLLTVTLLFTILVSYTRIGIAILRIRSAEGRSKAFSTCSAHLAAIMCAFGPIIIIYIQSTPNPLLGAVVQILNNIVSPMLNSLIYSLRNKEVKRALKRVFCGAGLISEA